jgi:hypothetical protein
MKPKNTAKVFLTLIYLFLVCIPSALLEDQVQQQTGIIDTLKNDCNALWFVGKVKLSGNALDSYTVTKSETDTSSGMNLILCSFFF